RRRRAMRAVQARRRADRHHVERTFVEERIERVERTRAVRVGERLRAAQRRTVHRHDVRIGDLSDRLRVCRADGTRADEANSCQNTTRIATCITRGARVVITWPKRAFTWLPCASKRAVESTVANCVWLNTL